MNSDDFMRPRSSSVKLAPATSAKSTRVRSCSGRAASPSPTVTSDVRSVKSMRVFSAAKAPTATIAITSRMKIRFILLSFAIPALVPRLNVHQSIASGFSLSTTLSLNPSALASDRPIRWRKWHVSIYGDDHFIERSKVKKQRISNRSDPGLNVDMYFGARQHRVGTQVDECGLVRQDEAV